METKAVDWQKYELAARKELRVEETRSSIEKLIKDVVENYFSMEIIHTLNFPFIDVSYRAPWRTADNSPIKNALRAVSIGSAPFEKCLSVEDTRLTELDAKVLEYFVFEHSLQIAGDYDAENYYRTIYLYCGIAEERKIFIQLTP